MRLVTPLGALVRGALAGAVGSAVQSLFFRTSRRLAPRPRPDAFVPPEPGQQGEPSTETVARRFTELFMQRGPLPGVTRHRVGGLVHYLFGAAWGGLYGLAHESVRPARGLAGAAAFGSLVWMVSDNLILPAFRLAAWPHRYPVALHAYAWLAHLIYGTAVWGSYALLSPQGAAGLRAGLWDLAARGRLGPKVPRRLRPALFGAIDGVARLKAGQRLARHAACAAQA